jgi:hypothetical protein
MLLRSTLGALALGMLTAGPVLAAAQAVTLYDVGNNPLGSITSPLAANMMAFSTVIPFTVGGAAVTAGRATAANCTVAGNVTYTMAGGGSYTVPVVVGWTSLPLAVTGASASTATCTYANLN